MCVGYSLRSSLNPPPPAQSRDPRDRGFFLRNNSGRPRRPQSNGEMMPWPHRPDIRSAACLCEGAPADAPTPTTTSARGKSGTKDAATAPHRRPSDKSLTLSRRPSGPCRDQKSSFSPDCANVAQYLASFPWPTRPVLLLPGVRPPQPCLGSPRMSRVFARGKLTEGHSPI